MSYTPPNPNGQATMANSSPVVIASDQSAVLTKLTNGTQAADTIAGDTGQNAVLAAGSRKEVSFSTTTAQAVATTDVSNYRWVSVHIVSQGTSSNVTFQGSNDNSNWTSVILGDLTNTTTATATNSSSASKIWQGPIGYRYFRLNVTGISAGTTAGVVEFFSTPAAMHAIQSGVTSTAATGSAVPSTAFYMGIRDASSNLVGIGNAALQGDAGAGNSSMSVAPSIFNGGSYDRARSATAAAGTTGTGLTGVGALGFDGTNYQRLKTDTSGNQTVIGSVAAGTTDSGNPVKIGGVGRTTNPTAVTDGQRADAIFDKLGKQVVVGSIRDLKGAQQTTITNSTSETTIVSAVGSTFCDLYGLVLTNTSGAATKVTIKDATAGTTRFVFQVPATETRGFMLPESAAHNQAAVNNNWTATCGTAVTSLEVTALFVKNT